MNVATIAKQAFLGVVGLVVVLLLIGQLLGQPILLGYVATGSMEPTLNAGDGFVAVPSAVTDSPEVGDVVVFEATTLHGGGLTTHRIVDETEEGYVTRGDANPFTDQDGGEPHVTDRQIKAVALQVGGDVVRIPHLGTAVMTLQGAIDRVQSVAAAAFGVTALGTQGIGYLLVWLGVALLGLNVALEKVSGSKRNYDRITTRNGVMNASTILLALVLLVSVPATAAMVIPAGTHEFGILSSESPSDDPLVIEAGSKGTIEVTVHNGGIVPVVVFFDPASDGISSESDRYHLSGNERVETFVTIEAPEAEGPYLRHLDEHRYLTVLPPSTIATLHSIHPLLALLAVNVVLVTAVSIVSVAFLGIGTIRYRSASGSIPFSTRIRRRIRKWL